jgi:hypothetical protein
MVPCLNLQVHRFTDVFLQPEQSGGVFVDEPIDYRRRGNHEKFRNLDSPRLAQDLAKNFEQKWTS